MKRLARVVLPCLAAVAPHASQLLAQVAPAVVGPMAAPGFQLPTVGGSLSYAVNASESVSTGYYNQGGGAAASTNVSGDLAYLSRSKTHPFSAIYSGAVLAGESNQPTTVVQNLALSQVWLSRFWGLTATDAVSYLPSTATTGLSGVPGLGDEGVDPVQTGPVTGQGALTGYAPRVSNSSTLSVNRRLSGRTSVEGSGSFVLQRFTGDDTVGLVDSNQAVGSFGGSHILDARSSVNGTYTLSKITYSPDAFSSAFNVQGVNFGYARRVNRDLSLDAGLGPQWVKTHFGGEHTSVNLATDVSLVYGSRKTMALVSYVRGTNSGFGVIPGGFSDSINSSARRTFYRIWNGALNLNYTHTSDPAALKLPSFSLKTLVAGTQVSRGLTRSISVYGSYNAQKQSTAGSANASAAFRGLFQVVAFGVTFSPRPRSLGESQ